MTLSLSSRLFLSMLALTLSLLTATLMLARWSFNQGFLDYINSLEQLRLMAIADPLVTFYASHGEDWAQLSQPLFDDLVRRHLPPPPPPSHRPPSIDIKTNPAHKRHVPQDHRPPKPRSQRAHTDHAAGPPPKLKTTLFDQQGHHIAGDVLPEQGDRVMVNVMYNNVKIGQLQTRVQRTLESPVATAFSRQQARASWIIGTLGLFLATLISLILTRTLRAPIVHAIATIERLSRGDYDNATSIASTADATNYNDIEPTEASMASATQGQASPLDTTARTAENEINTVHEARNASADPTLSPGGSPSFASTRAISREHDVIRSSSWPGAGTDELARLNSNLSHLQMSLKKGRTARRRLLADISHELRTPLTILSGEIEALKDGLREFNSSQLNSLDQEVSRLRYLVEDLHQLSVSDVGGFRYRLKPLNLSNCLESVVTSLQQTAINNHHVIKFNSAHSDGSKSILLADEQRLTQLFTNILSNSISYTQPPGGIFITLQPHEKSHNVDSGYAIANTGESYAQVIFEDTAPGIQNNHHEQLFDAFFRLDKSANRQFGGAGLGLAICRNIVTAHRGIISASDSAHGGLRIQIILPLINL